MDEIKTRLADRIKHYREQLNMSQEQLGKAIGKDKQTIWRLEKARSWPEWDTLVGLCRTFRVTPDTLLAPEPMLNHTDPALARSPEEIMVVLREALNHPTAFAQISDALASFLSNKRRS